jgi:hypothetical protein
MDIRDEVIQLKCELARHCLYRAGYPEVRF